MTATSSSVELLGPSLGPEDEVRAWVVWAREFARDVVRPVGQALDKMDAAEVAAPGSLMVALLEQAHREGFSRLGAPSCLGGFDLGLGDECLVVEELATADAAIASLLLASPVPFAWAAACGAPSLDEAVAIPYFSGERADWIGCCAPAGAAGRILAHADGDGWSLTGETGALTGGAIATHALVRCLAGDGPAGGTALLPLDAPGVSRRPVPSGAGLRALCRAHVALDGVRIPVDHIAVGDDPERAGARAARARAASGIVTLGIGRAAYEGAARWARETMWTGRSGAGGEHLRPELFRMFTLLETARALARAAYVSADHARAAHDFAAEAATDVTEAVARLCAVDATPLGVPFLDGSSFDPDKLLRDAQAAHP